MVTVYPGARSAFGTAKETTPGTAVAAARWQPLTAFDATDKPMPLLDNGLRGSMATEYGMVMGPQWCEGTFTGPGFLDSLGDDLQNILGDYAVGAAVSGVYPHTFGLLNSGQGQPVTHTWVDFQNLTAGTGARAYPFVCLSELTLSGNAEGLFMKAGKFSSFPSAAAAGAPTNAPTAELVIPAWRSTVSIGGSASANVVDWSVTISRNLVVQHTADGTQAPYVIARGEVTATFKLTLVANDEAPLITQLVPNQQPAIVIVVDNGGVTANVRKLTLTMSKGAYETVAQKRDTLIGWDITGKALANATDAAASGGLSPFKAVVQNAITTY
jgi:hypothetical protein